MISQFWLCIKGGNGFFAFKYQEYSFQIEKFIIEMFTIHQCHKYHSGGSFKLATRTKCSGTGVYHYTVSRLLLMCVCVFVKIQNQTKYTLIRFLLLFILLNKIILFIKTLI